MKEKFIHLLTRLFSLFPIRNTILLESIPDYSDNTFALYKELLRRNVNKKYKIVWIAKTKRNEKNTCNINPDTLVGLIEMCYYIAVSKIIISCNYVFHKYRDDQINIFLNHAVTYKRIRDYYVLNNSVDINIVTSPATREIMSYQQNFDIDKTYAIGFSRNDDLFHKIDINKVLGRKYKKIIVWYPTFRQHKAAVNIVSSDLDAIPLIMNEKNAKVLNDFLIEKQVCLVVKPHFAQDVSYIKNLNLSNLKLIDDTFFLLNKISSYEFVGNCDALLTDYSSIFFDYLLCDKSIGLIWTDIEDYLKNPGLIDDYKYYSRGTSKIYTLEELKEFITNVVAGQDLNKKLRNELKAEIHSSFNPDNSSRVAEFIGNYIEKQGDNDK